jgi:hypothetical protein
MAMAKVIFASKCMSHLLTHFEGIDICSSCIVTVTRADCKNMKRRLSTDSVNHVILQKQIEMKLSDAGHILYAEVCEGRVVGKGDFVLNCIDKERG